MIPKRMKAAVYNGRKSVKIEEVDVPNPEPGYVLLKMENCGICGSDLHSYFGEWGQSKSASGHEVTGTVVACGAEATNVEVGNRVCVECFSHCGKCRFCETGFYNLCKNLRGASGGNHSGFAEYVIAHSSSLFQLPEVISADDAMMIEPLAVSYRAFNRTGASYQDTVLVIGAGTIGLLAIASAKVFGVRNIIVCARYDHQVKMALEMGADDIIQVPQQDFKLEIQKLTHGLGIDAVVETTASKTGINDALESLRKGGSLVLVGGYHKPLEVSLNRIVGKELRVTGSSCYGYSGLKKDFQWSAELISSGKIQASKLITNKFPLDEIERAFKIATDKSSGSIKVQVFN